MQIKLEKKMITRDKGYYYVIIRYNKDDGDREILCKKGQRYWFDKSPNKHTLIHHKDKEMKQIASRIDEPVEVVKVNMLIKAVE